ncbi:hypothetical protein NDU88_006001 [Pleurodeles waltl]|uniref:Uncharacterized protein n=1 Tax=Pleurodeles waltl TaxID=8319 RepID=A0AAV7NS63_PLEWA|nr:hypothetical protein NDU88_006001 [Pleurodeles waltl]
MRTPLNPEEPSRDELLSAIQGSRVALEGKIETAAVEINLLWADLRKVSDKVKVAEGSIVELQTEVGALGDVAMVGYEGQGGPGRTEGLGSVTHWASEEDSPDWRSRDAGRLVDAGTGGSAVDSHHRVEIQQDGTMAVVAADLVGGTAVERGLGVGGNPAVACL